MRLIRSLSSGISSSSGYDRSNRHLAAAALIYSQAWSGRVTVAKYSLEESDLVAVLVEVSGEYLRSKK